MRKVELSYNPYARKTFLWVDGEEYIHKGSRVSEFVIGRPMDQWISDYSVSYKHWDGFLPELTEELNDDKLDLVFRGIKEDYDTFSTGIIQTYEDVRNRGFEPDNCRLSWKSKYEPENMLHLFRQFAREKLGMLTTQLEIIRMETLCARLEQADSMEIDDIQRISNNLAELLRNAAEASQTDKLRNYWKGAERQFARIYEEGR